MTKSDLFRTAHAAARTMRDVAYRVAFAAGLRAAYAALKAPARLVRTLHAHAGRAWVAAITGRDAKFGLARAFLPRRDVTGSGNTYRDLEIVVEVREGAVYEWSCQESARRQERGYWIVRGGRLVTADRAAVCE